MVPVLLCALQKESQIAKNIASGFRMGRAALRVSTLADGMRGMNPVVGKYTGGSV